MNGPVVIRPLAQADLEEQRDYFENINQQLADRYLEAVEKTFDLLARFPMMGRQRDYDNPQFAGMRMRPVQDFEKHLIFYIPSDDGIEIVRVLHSARDLERLFAPET